MEINLKKFLGFLLIVSALAEFAFTYYEFRQGKYSSYPWAAEIGFIMMLVLGIVLLLTKKKD